MAAGVTRRPQGSRGPNHDKESIDPRTEGKLPHYEDFKSFESVLTTLTVTAVTEYH